MKILVCTGIFPPEVGGPATYSELLASSLSKEKHDIKVITYSDESHKSGDEKYQFKLIRVTRSWLKGWHYFKYLMAIRNYGRDADVLYAQDTVSSGYPAYLAAKRFKKSLVVKVTGDYSWEQAVNRGLSDVMIDEFQKQKSYPSTVQKIRRVQIKVCKAADMIITPSHYLKELVAGWGVDEDKIRVVYNSVPKALFGVSSEEIRSRLKLSTEDFLIFSAGRQVKWKGFEKLREVVKELKGKYPNMNLKIFNNQPQKIIKEHLAAADIFVLNSGYEGMSHLILEAMSAGKPIITTNVGGTPEIIEDGINGILVDYNDKEEIREAILKFYNDKGLRDRMGENALKKFEGLKVNFSRDSMISRTEELLKSVA